MGGRLGRSGHKLRAHRRRLAVTGRRSLAGGLRAWAGLPRLTALALLAALTRLALR